MSVNGYLKIKTKIDNSNVDKGVQELENKINKLQDENLNLSQNENTMQQEIDNYYKLQQEADKYKNKINQLKTEKNIFKEQFKGNIPYDQMPRYDSIQSQLEGVKAKYRGITEEIDKQAPKIEKVAEKLSRIKNKQSENNEKIQIFKDKIDSIKTNNISQQLDKVGQKTGNIINKIGKWALAVFGIRTAYNAVRTAMSTLAQYNQQLATDINYIKFALAKTLEPLVLGFVNVIFKLLAYVNYLAQAWFNVNLFAKASAKSFSKASGSLGSATKYAKELHKTIEGFDEMNIIQENGTTANSTGIGIPSMDLSKIQDVEIPEWLVKFKEFCQPVIDFFNKIIEKYGPVAGGIAIVVGALAGFLILRAIIKLFTGFGKVLGGVSADFTGLLNGIGKGTKIIAILGGLALVITSVTNLLKTVAETGISIGDIALILASVLGEVAIAFVAIAGASKLIDIQGIFAIITALGGLSVVLLTVIKLMDTFAKSGLSVLDVVELLGTVLGFIVLTLVALGVAGLAVTSVLPGFIAVVAGLSLLLIVVAETFEKILNAMSRFIQDTAPSFIKIIETINRCIDNTIYALGKALPPIIEALGRQFNIIFRGIAKIVEEVGNTVSKIIRSIGSSASSVLDSIRRLIKQIGDTITQVAQTVIWFIDKLGPAINRFVDNTIISVTKLVNFIVSAIEYLVNTALRGLNGVIGTMNEVPGVNISRITSVYIPRFRPRLAKGGVISQPTTALIGEAGKEAVVPLENNMEWLDILADKLASKIGNNGGSYIVQLDGRTVQRGIAKRQQQIAFATNGR